jgi:ribosomal protein L28
MVRDIIFVDLDHRPPRPLVVVKFRLSTNGNDTGVIRGDRDEAIQRVWRDGLGKVSTSLGRGTKLTVSASTMKIYS